jgi:GntR family transcriptional regulator, vanillate catabolism transcriptional regulator
MTGMEMSASSDIADMSQASDAAGSGALAQRKRTGAQAVTESIRSALLDGNLGQGRINEVHLANSLGVSRTPVRAALQMLAGEGLLDHAPNRGFAVRAFSLDEIGDAFEVRALNEGLACRLAAERGLTLAQNEAIGEVLGRGDRLLSGHVDLVECRRGYAEVNTKFHATLLEAAGSRLIGDVLKLCNRVPQTTTHNVMAFNLDDVRQRHAEHHAIYKAVALREPQSAQAQMREHILHVKNSLVRSVLAERIASARGASSLG